MEEKGSTKARHSTSGAKQQQDTWKVVTRNRLSINNSQLKGSPLGSPPQSPTTSSSSTKVSGFSGSRQAVRNPASVASLSSVPTSSKSSGGPSSTSHLDASSTKAASLKSANNNNNKEYLQHCQPSQDLLQAVASDLPKKCWKSVFRSLMKSYPYIPTEIENIESDNYKDLGEQKFQALSKWMAICGSKATLADLDDALRKNKCSSVADRHTRPLLRLETSTDYKDGPAHKKEERVPNFKVRLISVEDTNIEASLDGDTVTFTIPSRLFHDVPKSEDDSSFGNRSQVAVALLDTIINPMQSKHRYQMKLAELADRFEEKYGSCFKFRQLGVGKLANFIRQSCWFTLGTDSAGEYYVEQTTPKQRPSFDNALDSVVNDVSSLLDSSDSEFGYDTCQSKVPSPSQTPFAGTPFSTPPPHRKTRSQRNLLHSLNIQKTGLDEITEEQFDQLLRKPQSKALKFVLESEYLDRQKFSHDIVSMWNTPNRQSSYTIVGVSPKSSPPHDLVGLKDPKNDKHYQSLFLEDSFSYKPSYRYSEIIKEDRRYGVITIPSSRGCKDGDPCYAEKTDPGGQWHRDNICYCNPDNAVARRKATKRIIKWFGDSLDANVTSPKEDLLSDDWNQDWELIKTQLSEWCHGRVHCLVVSRCSSETRYLGALGNFPWVKVWDFDPDSLESGVLSACKECMGDRVKISSWKDVPEGQNSLSDGVTDWIFARGMSEEEDTLMDTTTFREWFSKVKVSLNVHCKQLAQHCENKNKHLLVVILWYADCKCNVHLTRLLAKIDEETEGTKFVLIMPNLPQGKEQQASLDLLCQQFDIDCIAQIPLSKLCHELYHCPCPFQFETSNKHKLPVSNGTYDPDINDRDALWYEEEIEILYADEIPHDPSSEAKAGESFCAGGLLKWSDCDFGMFDAKRSLYKPLMQQLISYVQKHTSAVVMLLHEPRAGGTTLGRRLLWDLHLMTPCAYINSHSFNAGKVYERLESLYHKTSLPVVVLLDGAEPKLVKELELKRSNQDIPIVMLVVQRSVGEVGEKTQMGNQHLLTGKVDHAEAVSLSYVFSHTRTEGKQRLLRLMVEEVKQGQSHCLIEFGLAVHGERYSGAISFVRGYLALDNCQPLPWQISLGYLAIAFSYANADLPREFFKGMLTNSEIITLDDLTYNGKQLVSEDPKELTWTIPHQIIANEILEQLLCPQSQKDSLRECKGLSRGARLHLANFAMSFLTYASQQMQKMSHDQRSKVMGVIYDIFFCRDEQMRHRPSRLISDVEHVDAGAGIENSREKLLSHLAQSFPEDPFIGTFL